MSAERPGTRGGYLKKRLCIFSFYDPDGYVDGYVPYLLNDLSKSISRLVIAVNGQIDEEGRRILQKFTNEIFVRENIGYDAGAYQHILTEVFEENMLSTYEEVIFCNNTFFGPLTTFEYIFSHMECRSCDFWGLYGYFDSVFSHIQSYFLVFRRAIIEQKLLINYFRNFIDGTTANLKEIYGQFELGLFDFFVRENNMSYDCYARKCHIDVYCSSYESLRKCELPIVKKKVFSNGKKYLDNIWCTLSYIKYETKYDVNLILDYIRRVYGLDIRQEEIQKIEAYTIPDAILYPRAVSNEEQIEAFLSNNRFYIYGAGVNGSKCYWRFAKKNADFKGFIVSDGMRGKERELYGKPIFEFSEVSDVQTEKVLVAVEKQYADEIVEALKNKQNILRIF